MDRAVPRLNSSYQQEWVHIYPAININIAMASERGLVTPVLRNANQKTILELNRRLKDLVRLARDGKLQPKDYSGGTFTLTNLGTHNIRQFNPIINPPQAAILAVGSIAEQPFAQEGLLGIRSEMTVTLALDHRVVDGAEGADFLNTLKKYLESSQVFKAWKCSE